MGHPVGHHNGVAAEGALPPDAGHKRAGERPARFQSREHVRCLLPLQAITQDKQDLRNMYECPVYKTRTRGPTYVWTFNLKTKDKPSKWTLAGVALLLQV